MKIAPIRDKNNQCFTYWIPDCLHRGISEVDKLSGGQIITDQPFGLPAKEKYIISSLMDEAIASSQLEGASTEYRIAKEMLRSGRKPKDKNKQHEISRANDLLGKFRGLNLRQKSLIYHSIQHPDTIYSIEAHKNTHGIAYDTARKDLLALASKGFLKIEKEGKKLLLFFPTGKVIEKLHNK